MAKHASVELLDVQQAARIVGRTPETVRRWIWSGRLPAVKSGNKLLIDRADLAAIDPAGTSDELSLAAWATAARTSAGRGRKGATAADLVLEDRDDRTADARR
jgi:excisionase family DNA binding protein